MNAQSAFHYDPFSSEVMANPLPFYKTLRAEHPVYYMPKYDMFVFSRFDAIVELLSQGDNVFIASEQTLPTPDHMSRVHYDGPPPQLAMDPLPRSSNLGSPWYEQIRQAQIKPLRPRGVAAIEDLMRSLARARLDALLPQGVFDLTQDYGGMVAAGIICHLFDLPSMQAEAVRDAVNAVTITDAGGLDLKKLLDRLVTLILPAVEQRRKAHADGTIPLIDGLIQYRFEGRPLSDHEVAMQLICVFVGGTETVPKITAHGLLELSLRPEQLAVVRSDLQKNVTQAIEEIVRYCAPAQWFARIAHKDTVVAGQPIRAGQRVMFLFASAARDEREFDRPDEFIWNRPIRRVLSFGFGQHHCIGVHLARLELRVLITEFLMRVPKFQFDLSRSQRLPSSFQWGWNSLIVDVRP
ncbi:MAG: cytochrome P450 [Pseudomonadota bacterium]|nr:cytochrome P450 [Pseudomonadota bacterium]